MIRSLFIDGGSTTSKIFLVEDNKKIAIKKIYEGMNIQTREEHTLLEISKIAEDFINEKFNQVYVGMPGIHQFRKYDKIRDLFKKNKIERKNVHIKTDIEIQQLLFCEGINYIAISLGSGAVLISNDNNENTFHSGWGHLFGDEGSAYTFSKIWIKQATIDYENNINNSKYIKKILEFFEYDNFQDIKYLYDDLNLVKGIFQKLTVDIMMNDLVKYYEEIQIVLDIMCEDFFSYFDRIKFAENIKKVYLLGGMTKNEYFQTLLINSFVERGYKVECK